MDMNNVNMSTEDTVITVSARLKPSTHRAAKLKAIEEGVNLSAIYDKAIRKYVGLDDLPKEGAAK